MKEERKVVELSIDDILPNRFQPRIKFDDSAIFELSESIKAHGVFQPIIVRPIGDKYEIIAGERRYKASVLANKKTVPAIVMNLDDADTVEIALIENVQRANLTPIEEAISYKKILDMGYMNQEQLAQKLGKTQSTIANKLRLLNLDEDVQEALLENKISERHARSILKIKDYNQQKILLKKIVDNRLTVRKTDEEIEKMMNSNNIMNDNPVLINNEQNNNFTNINNFDNTNINSSIPEVVNVVSNQESIPEVVNENQTNNSAITINPFINNESSPILSDVNNEIINPTNIMDSNSNSSVINSSVPENNINVSAPTEINIDSITSNAQNVNVEKKIAPMDEFLKSSPNVNPGIVSPTTPDDSDNDDNGSQFLKPGKFFDFNYNDDNDIQDNNMDYSESKNFTFDNLYGNVNSKQPIQTNNNNEPIQTNNQDNFSNSNLTENKFQNIEQNPTPVFDFNPVNSQIQTQDTNIIQNNNNESKSNIEPSNNINSEPVLNIVENNNSQINNNISSPFGFESSTDLNDEIIKINDNNENNLTKSSSIDESSFVAPAINNIPQYQPIESDTPVISNQKNIMTAVNALRDTISKIESMGFTVDSDEIDLENMYQLIIKISK